MSAAVLPTVVLCLLMALLLLAGVVVRHSAKDVLTKQTAAYALAAGALGAGLGAGLARVESLTTVLYLLQIVALLLGIAHVRASRRLFAYLGDGGFWSEWLLTGAVLMLLASAFAGLFGRGRTDADLLPALLGWGPFLLPLLFRYAYKAWRAIPPRVYRKWFYPVDQPVPLLELADTVRLNVRVAKVPDAPELASYVVKAPIDRTLHDMFHYLIFSHNAEENPEQPILYHEGNNEGSLLGWIFYKPRWGGLTKQFLDPALTLTRNGVRANDVIVARSFTND